MANSELRDNAHWGVLRLTLGPGTYGWQFVTIGGATFDAGNGTCRP